MAAPPPILDFNLATRPFRNNTLLWTGFGLGVFLVLALSAWNVRTYTGSKSELETLRGDMATYQARLRDLETRNENAKRGVSRHDLESLVVQTNKANDVIQLKAFSWTTLFNRLEEVLPYNVRTERIRPVFRIGKQRRDDVEPGERAVPILVEGTCQELMAFLDFEGALLASPYFDRVEPERHQKAGQEIEFELRFMYYPDRAEETAEDEAAGDGETPDEEAVAEPQAGPEAEAEVAVRPADDGGRG
jgi:Tfp pilus assembly protein PilN